MERTGRYRALVLAVMVILLALLQLGYQTIKPVGSAQYSVEVVNTYHHSVIAFTQGLVYEDGLLYESTGLYGQSFIKVTELPSGKILERVTLPENYFGEGMTILGENIYQVTWRENTGFVYSLDLEEVRTFTYQGEGWGLTNDGVHLIMSNGSSIISYHDPDTFEIFRTIEVAYDNAPVINLNELEYVDGIIFANIWHSDQVVMINSVGGAVVGWIEMEFLRDELDSTEGIDVLNGIAYNPETGNFYVTGKLWPNFFEIRLVPK